MKGSKLLLVFIFIITAALGAAAVWIGWRLSQEEEVTPEESEAALSDGTLVNICGETRCPPTGWSGHDANPACNGCSLSTGRCEGPCVKLYTCDRTNIGWGTNGAGDSCMVCERNEWPGPGQCAQDIPGGISELVFNQAFYDDCMVFQRDVWSDANRSQLLDFVVWAGRRWEQWPCDEPTTTTTTTSPPTTTTTTTSPPTTTTTTTLPPTTTAATTTTTTAATTTTTTTTTIPGQPAFDANKEASVVCINNNTAAQVTYTITAQNISTVSGTILSVTDTYDSRFQSSWVGSFDPTPDSRSGNVLTWNNGGAGYTLAGGASTTFTYVVTVPSEYFGTYDDDGSYDPYQYRNFAIVQPEVGEDIELETTVEIICLVPTGLLDSATGAILVAIFLIILGFITLRYQEQVLWLFNKASTIKHLSPMRDISKGRLSRVKDTFVDIKSSKKEKFERKLLRSVDEKKGKK